MSGFDSLTTALEGMYDKPLRDLPKDLQKRIEQDFSPMPWDDLSPDQRRSVAQQWDYQNDPATEQDRQFWWDFIARKGAIEEQIAEWEAVATPTASDLTQRETRLAELRRELAVMEQKEQNARGDYLDPRSKRPDTSPASGKADYIPYPKALKLLSDRLNATREEIAAWVWMGPNEGGLAAYQNANELEHPPRFYFDYYMDEDYLAPLMACWFLVDDVSKFQPADRFITGKALIERWGKQPGIQPEAFIRAKLAESRFLDVHPTLGGTRGSSSDDGSFPPLETGLFALSQVKEIESFDFGSDAIESPTDTKHPGHLNHDPQMQQRANEIAAELTTSTGRVPTRNKVAKKLATELGMPVETVERRIRAQWKNRPPSKRLNRHE